MLTKTDLKNIDSLIKKNIDARVPKIIDARVPKIIKSAFQEFYDSIFASYVEKNESEHGEMIREIKLLRKDTDETRDYIKDHDSRLKLLENSAAVKN